MKTTNIFLTDEMIDEMFPLIIENDKIYLDDNLAKLKRSIAKQIRDKCQSHLSQKDKEIEELKTRIELIYSQKKDSWTLDYDWLNLIHNELSDGNYDMLMGLEEIEAVLIVAHELQNKIPAPPKL